MRGVKYLVAAAAASLFGTAALAADLPIAPPPAVYAPPADFGGWYLRGDIGFSNQQVKNIAMADGRNAALLSLNETTSFDTAGVFQLGVGYQFNNWFRADLTGQYRGNSNFKGTDHVTFPFNGIVGTGVNNYGATKSEWVVMGNVYADLGTWYGVTPFIGAGVGAARINIANYTDNGAINVALDGNGQPFMGGPFTSFASAPAAARWNFAWALHTGLAYRVTPGMTVELGYSYMNLGQAATGAVSTYDGFTRGVSMQFHDITSHDLKLGVRWSLDSGPVYAPPIIRKG